MSLALGDLDLLVREFRLNGFAVLEGLIPVDLLADFSDQLQPVLRGEYKRMVAGHTERSRGAHRLAIDLAPYEKVLSGQFYDDVFTHNPAAEELVDAILSPQGPWRRGWTQVECAWKGSDFMGWHSDQTPEDTPDPLEPNKTIRLTFNIPLVDFTWANGSMQVIPGSHLLPRAFHSYQFEKLPRLHAHSLPLRRGDAIIRDGNMLHRGTPNLTDEPRPMLDQTYKSVPNST